MLLKDIDCLGVIVLSFIVLGLSQAKPNYVIFLADDVGWRDLVSYGHPTQEYGAVDGMAAEGLRFTQWYSAASVCTPSRSAILTGRLPIRTGVYGDNVVLYPGSSGGLPHSEITIAEALKTVGYKTGIVGKWHLGINEAINDDGKFLPHTQGFDFVGTIIPFSVAWSCDTDQRHMSEPARMKCFLYENTTIVQQPIQLKDLSERILRDAQSFIHEHSAEPFFLLVSLPQCHTPMFSRNNYLNKSKRGIYGDQMNEMQWVVGEILSTLKSTGIDHNTMSVFLSDNGPHREICEEGGHPGPFKEGKLYYMEGGYRVPAIVRWPGVIPAGIVSTALTNSMDLFPTLLELSGVTQPADRVIDGRSFASLLLSYSFISETRVRNTTGWHTVDLVTYMTTLSSQQLNNIHTITQLNGKLNITSTFDDREELRRSAELERYKQHAQYLYCDDRLIALRYDSYKVYFYKSKYPSREFLSTLCSNGFPLQNYMSEGGCPDDKLNNWLIFDVESDPSEDWELEYDKLGDDIKSNIAQILEEHEKSKWDTRAPLVTKDRVHTELIPCCNPPYCLCNFTSISHTVIEESENYKS